MMRTKSNYDRGSLNSCRRSQVRIQHTTSYNNRINRRRDDDSVRFGTNATFGTAVTAILAFCVGTSTFAPSLVSNTSTPYSPLTYVLLFVWAITKIIQISKRYWFDVVECVHQVETDVVTRVASSQTLTRIKSSVSASSTRLMELATVLSSHNLKIVAEQRTIVIAASTPFLPLDDIVANLSLSDIRDLMRYALDRNRMDFKKQEFLSTLTPKAREAADAMDRVVLASRGSSKTALSTRPLQSTDDPVQDMDALFFVAMMRIFAEWRSIRLVPDGYKRYSAGINIAKRDLLQNIHKIETAVHKWMEHRENSRSAAVELANGRQLSSPTLKQLLKWEEEQNVHPRLPKLADKSGASGLLWTFRQLQYQTSIFDNLTQVPAKYASSKDAVAAAYKLTYGPYHGFLVKQVFQSSFDASPDVDTILNHMNIEKNTEYNEEETAAVSSDEDSLDSTKVFVSSSSSSNQQMVYEPPQQVVKKSKNIFEEIGDNIVREWMKLERLIKECKGAETVSDGNSNVLITVPSNTSLPMRRSMTTATTFQTAEEEIPSYLAIMNPVLIGLDNMIVQMNMKDPSKC